MRLTTLLVVSKFWRRHRRAPRAQKPSTDELFLGPSELAALTGEAAAPKFHWYPIEKMGERYNGRGDAGTGGPKKAWLYDALWINMFLIVLNLCGQTSQSNLYSDSVFFASFTAVALCLRGARDVKTFGTY